MRCSSCDKQREDIHPKKSKLVPGVVNLLCDECIKARMEPRHIIIMAGRTYGTDVVTDIIRTRRYVGADILAKEILKK